ncbi:MAG TPA: DUF4070 domain-containing protein [Solirubrobacteraceae bacterium]|nr:DUF4070 domain-containing protein [Solirubrobacteraceae bacterium]
MSRVPSQERPPPQGAASRATGRRVLLVAPRYTHSFGTFDHAFPLAGVKAFMPPQGILTVAAHLPSHWHVRFVDENVRELTDGELEWAEVVMTTGMHVQRGRIAEIVERARGAGALTVLGGPSVSGEPRWYPEPHILHVGELGDATDRLIARLEASVEAPVEQEIYVTEERLELSHFPLPAYERVDLSDYLIASLQWSSGCPYRCEFCDIPELYGRKVRLKPPERVTRELDAMLESGNPGVVYFVDDNFVANPRATVELLKALVAWQQQHEFPVAFCCEATLNAAKRPEVLALMREANFQTIFCGIESPDEQALRDMKKTQNVTVPLLEAVQTFNDHGLEVVSGIIVGLDSDSVESYEAILAFIERSQIPLLTINVLYALPRTPLWRRLEQAGRIVEDPRRVSNVEFLLPYETVIAGWRRLVGVAYEPAAIYGRFRHQIRHTYPNRRPLPGSRVPRTPAAIRRTLKIIGRVLWHAGIRAPYRREFWRTAVLALRCGEVEGIFNAAMVSHHLIAFTREALADGGEAAFYSPGAATGPRAGRPPQVRAA